MAEHIVKSYEDELNSLAAECARLGGLAEAQLADAIRAVTRREPDLAGQVIQQDDRLDEIEAIIKIVDIQPPKIFVEVKFISTKNSDLLERGIRFYDPLTQKEFYQLFAIFNSFHQKWIIFL